MIIKNLVHTWLPGNKSENFENLGGKYSNCCKYVSALGTFMAANFVTNLLVMSQPLRVWIAGSMSHTFVFNVSANVWMGIHLVVLPISAPRSVTESLWHQSHLTQQQVYWYKLWLNDEHEERSLYQLPQCWNRIICVVIVIVWRPTWIHHGNR